MAEKDFAAAAALKYKPVQSAVPGTTLGSIQINAFLSGGVSSFICSFPCKNSSPLHNYTIFIF